MQSVFLGFKTPHKALQLLEKMYLYGAFSKHDVMALFDESFSASEKRLYTLIKTFGDNHIKALAIQQKSGYYADYDYLKDIYNYMMKIYRLKTTTPSRLKAYFLILSALHLKSNQTVFELLDLISLKGHVFNDSFLRNLLEDMVDHGVIVSENKGRTIVYSIAADSLSQLDNQSILELIRALKYFSNAQYPFAIGDLTLKNTQDYVKYHRNLNPSDDIWLRVTNRSFHLTLYEEYIWTILKMMDEGGHLIVNTSHLSQSTQALKPLAFELPVDDGELYLKGKLSDDTIAYVPLYAIMDNPIPEIEIRKDCHQADADSKPYLLSLNIAFDKDAYQIHRLIALYPHAAFTIKPNSVDMDLSTYDSDKQIEITLEQIFYFNHVGCNDAQRLRLKQIFTEGVNCHENDE